MIQEKKVSIWAKRNILICSVIIIIAIATIGVGLIYTNVTWDSNINTRGKIEETQAITISSREKNINNYIAIISEDNLEVPVPKGYVASPDVEERYVNGVTTVVENVKTREHHGGFVIYERLVSDEGKTDAEVQAIIEEDMDVAQRTRNQWVWVPIADATDMYIVSDKQIYASEYIFNKYASCYEKNTASIYSNPPGEPVVQYGYDRLDYDEIYLKKHLEGISRNELLQEMREEFYEMVQSVATYGGFYIGRYETGNTQKNNLRVVKGFTGTDNDGNANNGINYITWYDAYKRSKQMRGTSPVHTNLIWGIQKDETLKWLIDSEEKTYEEIASDSSSWGNYTGVSFTYTQTSRIIADGTGTKAGGTGTKGIFTEIIPTGSTERNKANNIYDLAGNMSEWTMKFDDVFGRTYYGGNYKYSNNGDRAVTRTDSNLGPNEYDSSIGVRMTLYIL